MSEQAIKTSVNKRICYIDDSKTSSFVTKRMLVEEGCSVDHFLTAEDALEAILSKPYDIVITDLMISSNGGVNGDDLIHLIRNSGHPTKSKLPIIVVTGASDIETKQELLAEGANSVLNKPLNKQQLSQAIVSVTEASGTKARFSIDDPVKGKVIDEEKHKPLDAEFLKQPKSSFSSLTAELENRLLGLHDTIEPLEQIPILNEAVSQESADILPEINQGKRPVEKSGLDFEEIGLKKKQIEPRSSVVDIPLLDQAPEFGSDNEELASREILQPSQSQTIKPEKDEFSADDLTLEDLMMPDVLKGIPVEEIVPDEDSHIAEYQTENLEDVLANIQRDIVERIDDGKPDLDLDKFESKIRKEVPEEKSRKEDNPLLSLLDHLDDWDANSPKATVPDFRETKHFKINIPPRTLKIVAVSLVLLLIIPTLVYLAVQETVMEVDYVLVEQGPIHESIQVTGRVVSKKQIEVTSFFPGQIVSVKVKEGDTVKKGQVLATLDDRDAKSDINRAQANLMSIQENVSLASKTVERLQRALEKGAVSRQMVEDAEAGWKSESAKQSLAEEELKQAKLKYERLSVVAPFDGLVSEILSQSGQWLAPPEALLKLVDVNNLEIELKVDVADSGSLREDQVVEVSSDAFPGKVWEERITRIASTTSRDNSANLVSVLIKLGDQDPGLRVGQQVDARVRTASNNRALKVPFEAIQTLKGQAMVAVELNQRVHFVPVVTGIENFSHVEITQGLSLNQRVLLPGGLILEEGQKIAILDR